MRLVEQIYTQEHKEDFKTRYIKYRAGRIKHQYWLWNRKRTHKVVDCYDAKILQNCQPGKTAFFNSAGYYLKDIWPQIDAIEMYSVVKEFCPSVIVVNNRQELSTAIACKYDNFAVVNNRSDHWVSVQGLSDHLQNYCKILNENARVFYSIRDTQIHYNRLTVDAYQYFLDWAISLQSIDLQLVWHDFQFRVKEKNQAGNYDALENPDTVNGNLKFWFTYKGLPWTVQD